jgi:YidC/Oxa1 family membrane protein insertase
MPTISANVIQDAFGPLIKVFETILVFIHAHITGGSWGLAIIGLTIVVRAALVPLTLKQFSSMAKLQALGPELKELQKRYKDDKQKLNEEMMKFYKANEVNPFGSCLPLVLQLPVFLSLFYMLRVDLKKHICGAALQAHHITSQAAIAKQSCGAIDANSGKFLFIPDITTAASGVVLAVLIVLYVGSQLVSSLLTTATVDKNQRMLMLGLPFVFSIFIARFPAGLLVYWITTNLWTVGQQYIVRRRAAPILPAAVAVAVGGGGAGGKAKAKAIAPAEKAEPQGLMARLAATRDAARSAVSGASQAGAPAKNGRAAPRGSAGGRGKTDPPKPTRAGSKATAADTKEVPARRGPRGSAVAKASPTNGAAGKAAGGRAATGKAPKAPAARSATGKTPTGKTPSAKPSAAKPSAAAPRGGRGAAKADDAAGVPEAKEEAAPPRTRGSAPPPPPRKKKKRSGRRR